MNDTRNSLYSRITALPVRSAVLVCFGAQVLSPLTAFAEVGLPPPVQHQNAGFPSDQALQRRGYDPKTGIWKVDVQNNGKPTVTKNGGNINGSQGKNVTVTGRYGETGTMNTTVNQRVGTSAIQKTATGVWFGSSAANALSKNGSYVATQLRAGNYQSAFEGSVLALGDFGNNLFGGLPESIVNLGRSLGLVNSPSPQQFRDAAERFYAGQRQAEAEGNYQKAVAEAAAKKAAEAAQKAQQQDQQKREEQKKDEEAKKKGLLKYQLIVEVDGSYQNYVFYAPDGYRLSGSDDNTLDHAPSYLGKFVSSYNIDIGKSASPSTIKVSTPSDKHVFVRWTSYKKGTVPKSEEKKITQNQSQVKPEDFMLTQKEMLDILKRMLENNQTNHAELMNQLAKMGVMNQSAEPSTFSPDTALSAPYTPEGSSTPQQTRFKMNQDGTVGVDYVPRPDLKPNSPEAPNKPEKTTPSRQESPDTPNAPNSPNSPNTPNEPNSPNSPNNQQTPKQQENGLCSIFPNIAACADLGEVEAQEPEVPQNTIDIGSIKPTDTFKTDGVCPSPKTFDMGILGTFEMSYENVCYIASKIRPILILVTIISCGWAAYAAVKEL
ncbi:Neisseria meningitidis TspB protein [Neisseria subflava]|uniref:Neisseria meningitidis TspB protein n=1 Tax=Neisseria subflava TaxID=28449 RepID=A0A9X9QYA2_NEISU|nr:IgG-binding virulence factor TspB family protein [Neisseria subflava]VTY03229.1 Neisseria meningitidis TspB protein [Neisseria subflava]